jgi:hypothetical protein
MNYSLKDRRVFGALCSCRALLPAPVSAFSQLVGKYKIFILYGCDIFLPAQMFRQRADRGILEKVD